MGDAMGQTYEFQSIGLGVQFQICVHGAIRCVGRYEIESDVRFKSSLKLQNAWVGQPFPGIGLPLSPLE